MNNTNLYKKPLLGHSNHIGKVLSIDSNANAQGIGDFRFQYLGPIFPHFVFLTVMSMMSKNNIKEYKSDFWENSFHII